MSILSPETTKKHNIMFTVGCSLILVQYLDIRITNIPLLGITGIEPNHSKMILAAMLIVSVISFLLSNIAFDKSDHHEKNFTELVDMIKRPKNFNSNLNFLFKIWVFPLIYFYLGVLLAAKFIIDFGFLVFTLVSILTFAESWPDFLVVSSAG